MNIEDVTSVSYDWKANPDEVLDAVLESINDLLTHKGLDNIHAYPDPTHEGSDMYGYIFSMDELSEGEIKSASRYINGLEDEDDDAGSDD